MVVYNQAFEKSVLKDLARDFPEYSSKLAALSERIVDLMKPFSDMHYYSSEMKGSYSIKVVLPVLVPGLSYKELAINNGGLAMVAYAKMIQEIDTGKRDKIRRDLLAYCRLDTLAMVDILSVLEK